MMFNISLLVPFPWTNYSPVDFYFLLVTFLDPPQYIHQNCYLQSFVYSRSTVSQYRATINDSSAFKSIITHAIMIQGKKRKLAKFSCGSISAVKEDGDNAEKYELVCVCWENLALFALLVCRRVTSSFGRTLRNRFYVSPTAKIISSVVRRICDGLYSEGRISAAVMATDNGVLQKVCKNLTTD